MHVVSWPVVGNSPAFNLKAKTQSSASFAVASGSGGVVAGCAAAGAAGATTSSASRSGQMTRKSSGARAQFIAATHFVPLGGAWPSKRETNPRKVSRKAEILRQRSGHPPLKHARAMAQ